jgi:hypothetical protein
MSRKEMENLKQQIDEATQTLIKHSTYNNRTLASQLENELIENRIKERTKAEDEEESEREREHRRSLRLQARQQYGGVHCHECTHH